MYITITPAGVSSGGGGGGVTITANRLCVSDNTGALVASATTSTQAGYLSNVTSDIQAQIDSKLSGGLTDAHIFVGGALNTPVDVPVSGDLTLADTGAFTVATVGTSSAANIHAGEVLANASTSANTINTIVKRDGSGNFSAGTITATLSGTATNFSGSLVGDVTGTQGATVVALVGTSTAANVHAAELLANASTPLDTVSTIVKRDGSGNFAASQVTVTDLVDSGLTASTVPYADAGKKLVSSVVTPAELATVSGSNTGTTIQAQLDTKQSSGLTTNHVLVGVAGVATDVAMSGDVGIVASGATTIAAVQGTVVSGVTGTGNVVFSASPTLTGTLTAATIGASGNITGANLSGTNTGDATIGTANGLSVAAGQVLSLQAASGTQPGALTAADWNTFNNKQSATLTAAHVLVGSALNVATDVALSQDATIVSSGALTVTGIQSHAVTNTAPTDAQVLVYNNGATHYAPVSLSSDITMTNAGAMTVANAPDIRYIDFIAGDDATGTGSETKPWKTLQHAYNSSVPTVNQPYVFKISGGNNSTDVGTITGKPNVNLIADYQIQIPVDLTISGGITNDACTFENIIFIGNLTWTRSDATAMGISLINCSFFGSAILKQTGAGSCVVYAVTTAFGAVDFAVGGNSYGYFANCVFFGVGTYEDTPSSSYYQFIGGYNIGAITITGGVSAYFSGFMYNGGSLTTVTSANGTPVIFTDSASVPATITGPNTLHLLSHATYEAYTPTTSADWASVPTTVLAGLDDLAGSGIVKSQTAKFALAAPNGAGGVPSFRQLLASDISGAVTDTLTSAHIYVGSALNVATDTALTGDVSITNTGVSTVSNAAVIGKVLTGYSAAAGTLAATDTILQGFDKLGATAAVVAAAASINTVSTLVLRDGSGNFAAGTITANLTGNASGSAASFTGNLVGDVTGTQGATVISAATVTGKAITGFVSGAGTITAADTILSAIDKLDGNIAAKPSTASPTFTGNVTSDTYSTNSANVASGATLTNVANTEGFVRITGATNCDFNSIVAGANGQMIAVYKVSTGTLTFTHEDAGSAAANRLQTPNNADIVIPATENGIVSFIYDSGVARWVLLNSSLTIWG